MDYLDYLRENGITHVIVGNFGRQKVLDRVLREVVEACSEAFSMEFQNKTLTVYRYSTSAYTGAASASLDDRVPYSKREANVGAVDRTSTTEPWAGLEPMNSVCWSSRL